MVTLSDEITKFQLTDEQLAQFHRDGFIHPIKVYSEDDIEQRWRSIRKSLVDRSVAAYTLAEDRSNASISNYDRHLDVDLLSEHIMKPQIVGPVTSILGSDVLCWRSEFFPKYAGDEGTDWHQSDTFANASGRPQLVWGDNKDESAHGGTLTAWTAFTDATIENGCLQLIPGTHTQMNYDENKTMAYRPDLINKVDKDGIRRGFFGYDYRELQKDPDWKPDEGNAVPIVLKRGETVFFWSTLMHASLPNTTENDYRMGFACRFVPTSVQIYPDTEFIDEYGGPVSLEHWAAVLVAGEDTAGFNKVATVNRRGTAFETW
ncbi:chlorinating enzyme [Nocardia sp. NPDC050793]|uniref:chlorinating enzyme n=1 Tax=Nocardia sp. NPDC050793 TaxID=3155159 RepID=UPI0033C5E9B6